MSKSLAIRFLKSSFKSKLLLFEASDYTIWAYAMMRRFSFKRYLNWLDNPKNSIDSDEITRQVFYTIRKVDKYAFWTTTCYTQAIAARLILKRNNIQSKIYLGMTKDENGNLLAHAWTKVGDKIITGAGNLEKYKILYVFEK